MESPLYESPLFPAGELGKFDTSLAEEVDPEAGCADNTRPEVQDAKPEHPCRPFRRRRGVLVGSTLHTDENKHDSENNKS